MLKFPTMRLSIIFIAVCILSINLLSSQGYCSNSRMHTESDSVVLKSAVLVERGLNHKNLKNKEVQLPYTWQQPKNTSNDFKGINSKQFVIQIDKQLINNFSHPALYIKNYAMSIKVLINGIEIHPEYFYPTRGWNTAFLMTLPNLNEEKPYKITFEVSSPLNSGRISVIEIGEYKNLSRELKSQDNWQKDLVFLSFILSLLLSTFVFNLWLYRRKELGYLFLALSNSLWCIYCFNYLTTETWINENTWQIIISLSLLWSTFFHLLFSNRFFIDPHKTFEKVIALLLIVFSVAIILITNNVTQLINKIICLALVAWILQNQIRQFIHNKEADRLLFSAILLLVLLSAIFDIVFKDQTIIKLDFFKHADTLIFSSSLLFVFLSWQLINRFINAMKVTSDLNLNFELRVNEQKNKIKNSLKATEQYQLAYAAEKQRSDIYNHLYQDLSEKLLPLIHYAQNSQQADAAKSALDDIKDATRSEVRDAETLDETLSDCHREYAERCQMVGLALQWEDKLNTKANASVLFLKNTLPASVSFNIRRVMREALSNIIKHAQANKVHVTVSLDKNIFFVEIHDNGIGFQTKHAGRGLVNMGERIKNIYGDLNFSSSATGTQLSFTVDINKLMEIY